MKIKVEQHHIDRGIRHAANLCPVALAIEEELSLSCRAYSIIEIGLKYHTITPIEVLSFMRRFDCGLPVEPFEFEIDYES